MTVIAAPESVWESAESFLFDSPDERFGFFLAGTAPTATGPRFCIQEFLPVTDTGVTGGWGEARELDVDVLLEAINEAKQTDRALIEVHTHPVATDGVTFSRTDNREMPEFASYALDSLNGTPYGALVLGQSSLDACYWDAPDSRGSVHRVTVAGEALSVSLPTSSSDDERAPRIDGERYDRQIRAFSESGQRSLSQTKVGIVGLGGLGCHVVQQLVYMGVRDFVLVDPDDVEETNLNRTVTAWPYDVGKPKTWAAERVIEKASIGERADVTTLVAGVQEEEALRALLGTDLVIGCLDNDGPRLVLNRVSRAAHLPYLDLASGITPPEGPVENLGGRVAFVHPDGPCLHCMEEIDREEARDALAPSEVQEEDRERGYIDDVPAPSVVSLNGSIASMATNEFFMYASHFDSIPSLQYHYVRDSVSETQQTAARRVSKDGKCLTCSYQGTGEAAGILDWEC